MSVYTGWLGGKLVQEYGESVKPAIKQLDEQRDTLNESRRPRSKVQTKVTANPL